MGCFPSQKKGEQKPTTVEKSSQKKSSKKIDFDDVLEDIMDIKTVQIKGAMLFSETIGKPTDQYEVLEQIASGTLASVKKVRNKISSCIRSMKTIKKALLDFQEDEKNFMKEIAILRTLDHMNILKIYEFYQDDKSFYLISEYWDNGDLFDKIQKAAPFPEHSACYLIYQLLSAIVYCHSNNIVHRDIKADAILLESIENVFIDGVGEVPLYNIRLSNFSSARSFNRSKKLTKKIGTSYFIAPEVLERNYNEKCDVWSIGVLLFVLLSGKPPFWGESDKEILEKIKDGKFDFRDEEWVNVSREGEVFVKSLLNKDPYSRPSAATALKSKWFTKFLYKHKVLPAKVADYYMNIISFNISPIYFFQQASLAYMVHHLVKREDLDEIRKFYAYIDKNGDGKMEYSEVIHGFKMFIPVNEKDLKKIFKYIDQADTGCIEYEEFIRACINKEELLTEENIKKTFILFTKTDEFKTITCIEFKSILGLQSKFSNKTWENIIKTIDKNGDNQIEYEEFKDMMQKFIEK